MTDATENVTPIKTVPEDPLTRRRNSAGKAIAKHFNSHPDGVIIASISNGRIEVSVTEFGSAGELLFAAKLINKYVNECFDSVLMNNRGSAEPKGSGESQ